MVVFTAEHHVDEVNNIIFSLDESTFASISFMYVCDSKTGYCISGLIVLARHGHGRDACFSPDGKHILIKFATFAVVWDIEMGEEQFQVKGSNFAFIHHDRRIIHAFGR